MKKKIVLTAFSVLLAASAAHGSAYRIPEQSTNSVALGGAYVAHTMGPDTAYFNPAAMSWQEDAGQVELSLAYINLRSIDYDDNRSSTLDGDSDTEHFFLPLVHMVSKDYNNFRFGFSLAYPAGLTKRWSEPFPTGVSDEFTLKVIELNPSISYKMCEHFSVAAGFRFLYADGTVKSKARNPPYPLPSGTTLSRDLDGDAKEIGYNLAMSLRPTDNWAIGVTYRSKVNLDLRADNAKLKFHDANGNPIVPDYRDTGRVSVPVPAVVAIGTSYTFFDKTTVELAWDRTFWSKYDHLDFEYDQDFDFAGHPFQAFDRPSEKDWRNSDTYRIGITHRCTDRFTAMCGFAIDSNPIPERNLNFEMPDSDAKLYSIGGRYQYSEKLSIGAGYLFYDKKSRNIRNNDNGIDGEFDGAGAHALNLGINYIF